MHPGILYSNHQNFVYNSYLVYFVCKLNFTPASDVFVIHPMTTAVSPGENATFICEINASYVITWYFNETSHNSLPDPVLTDMTIELGVHKSTLKVVGRHEYDGIEVHCTATNTSNNEIVRSETAWLYVSSDVDSNCDTLICPITPSMTPSVTPSMTPSMTPSVTPSITPSMTPSMSSMTTRGVTMSYVVLLMVTIACFFILHMNIVFTAT